jgi:4-diphosphocytidyl-2-C-methyl-D-erythritol kinase
MIAFPPCKINIGLYVTERRADGFHNISSVFYPVKINDILEVIEEPGAERGVFIFNASGLPVPGEPEANLVIKAYQLLAADFDLPAVNIHLHKVIPMGAGLGGGSADGAWMLRLLNQKFDLGLDTKALMRYAARLGSDCPFFINDAPALAEGRGEVLSKAPELLSERWLYLVHPAIHVSTRAAFAMLTPRHPAVSIRAAIEKPIDQWKELVENHFEEAVFKIYPAIKDIKAQLYEAGALYASMTGSGSGVYGIFKEKPPELNWPESYFTAMVLM